MASTDQTYASIKIDLLLDEEGDLAVNFEVDGMPVAAALGYLTVVSDRLRELEKHDWPTCAKCHEPMDDHEGGICP